MKENIVEHTKILLDTAAEFFGRMNGCSQYLPEIDRMRRKLYQPCVLAVGGKVKAGKSSFINALLGKSLAKVGELETTATINMFRHISEADSGYTPEKPVKVVWDNGVETYETTSFMDSLQGNDDATLQRAQGIAYLEFYEDNDILKELTLVDTPGTGAVVGKDGQAHEEVANRFFRLRQKHEEQTNERMAQADAVIYLVGAVAGAASKQFLDDFQETTSGASALNALGVLSKVDIDEALLERRYNQANYVAESLKDELFTVIPVSAGLHEAVTKNRDRLPQLQAWLKSLPPSAFKLFMRSDTFYYTEDQRYLDAVFKGCTTVSPSVDQRKAMKGDLQWALFRTISQTLYNADSFDAGIAQLEEIANMKQVRDTIKERFFSRSKIIRCNRILKDLQLLSLKVRRTTFNELRSNRADYDSWMSIINLGESSYNKVAADGLRRFISSQLPESKVIDQWEMEFVRNLLMPIEDLQQDIQDVDAGFQQLMVLQSRRDLWPEEEYEELCGLFGLYGESFVPEDSDISERQAHWQSKAFRFRDRRDQAVAEYAVQCYGKLLSNS